MTQYKPIKIISGKPQRWDEENDSFRTKSIGVGIDASADGYNTISIGTDPVAESGDIRFSNDTTCLAVRNNADDNDIGIITTSGADLLIVGGAYPTRPANISIDSTTQTDISIGGVAKLSITSALITSTVNVALYSALASPKIYQAEDGGATATGDNLTIEAQGVTHAGGGGSAGNLLLRGGRGTGGATNTDGNIAFGEVPADWKGAEEAIFIADAVTAPSSDTTGGAWLYSVGGVLNVETDGYAIHDNVSSEISVIDSKGAPVTGDYFIIEDSEDSDSKKSITMGDIDHDALTNFAANEHLDWTASVGTIHAGNYIEGGAGTDTTAIHDDTASEISALDLVTVAGGDHILIEDSDDSNNKKRIAASDLIGSGTDADAIHDNVDAEISLITEKSAIVDEDLFLVEDSEDGYSKKSVKLSSLPGGGDVSAGAIITDHSVVRGDGGTKGIQDSGLLIDDADLLSLPSGGKLGVGTVTVPHGAVGSAKLAIEGTSGAAGPNIQTTLSDIDDYPAFQICTINHDSVGLNFDAFYDGGWKSSDADSNFGIFKSGNQLKFYYDSSIAQGDTVTWNTGLSMTSAGLVTIPAQANIAKLGIGTATVPHGAVGTAMLAIDGADSSTDGPHIQTTTATDDYPLLQVRSWAHDNISLLFDSYWDGLWRSSDAGSNFAITKGTDLLKFWYDSSITPGNQIVWNTAMTIDVSGIVNIPVAASIGSSTSATGDLRHANATVGAAFRNFAGTNNITAWESNVSDRLVIGGATAGERPANISIDPTTLTTIAVAGNARFHVGNTVTTTTVPLQINTDGGAVATTGDVRYRNGVQIYAKDVGGTDTHIWELDTSDNLHFGDSTNVDATNIYGSAGVVLNYGATAKFTIGNAVNTSANPIAVNAGTVAGTGDIRGTSTFTLNAKDVAAADTTLITWASDNLYYGDSTNVEQIIIRNATTTQIWNGTDPVVRIYGTYITFGSAAAGFDLIFDDACVTPEITQATDPTASVVCDNLIIVAQGASNATGGGSAGTSGNLLLRGGRGTGHADNTDGNVAFGEIPGSADWKSAEECIFIADRVTAPTAAATGGSWLSSAGGVLDVFGALAIGSGSGAVATAGDIRLRNQFKCYAKDAAGTSAVIFEFNALDDLYIGDATHVDLIFMRCSSYYYFDIGGALTASIQTNGLHLHGAANRMNFETSCVGPFIHQSADATPGTTCDNLTIEAQPTSAASGTNFAGHLVLRGGIAYGGGTNLAGNVAIGHAPTGGGIGGTWKGASGCMFIRNAGVVPSDAQAGGAFFGSGVNSTPLAGILFTRPGVAGSPISPIDGAFGLNHTLAVEVFS